MLAAFRSCLTASGATDNVAHQRNAADGFEWQRKSRVMNVKRRVLAALHMEKLTYISGCGTQPMVNRLRNRFSIQIFYVLPDTDEILIQLLPVRCCDENRTHAEGRLHFFRTTNWRRQARLCFRNCTAIFSKESRLTLTFKEALCTNPGRCFRLCSCWQSCW